jgi:nucleoside-diphosphate kinase
LSQIKPAGLFQCPGELGANPQAGTIRKTFALSIGENSMHGSDAPETAAEEIAYWFSGTEIVS